MWRATCKGILARKCISVDIRVIQRRKDEKMTKNGMFLNYLFFSFLSSLITPIFEVRKRKNFTFLF
jgi:hypothetical protein